MSRLSRAFVRATIVASTGALVVGLVSGCGAGQVSQTASKQTAVGGINTDVGDIAIRNAFVVAPSENVWTVGSNVPVSLFLSNVGTKDDRLLSVSSPGAGSVSLLPSGDLPPIKPAPSAPAKVSSSPNVDVSATPTIASSPSASGSISSPPTFAPLRLRAHTVTILSREATAGQASGGTTTATAPNDTMVRPGYLVLNKCTRQLRSGDTVALKLTFAKAGSITLKLPVAVPATSRPRAEAPKPGEGE